MAGASFALEPVAVSRGDSAIDLTGAIDFYTDQSGTLKVSTAPDANGIVRRVEVRAKNPDQGANWAVFALANISNEQLDRLIVAPHYQLVDSGLVWPDLDSARITAITPSEGFSLERLDEDSGADVFLVTLDPGAVITFIAEQNAKRLPKLVLWDEDAYRDTVNSFTLYRGIVLGISGLLAVFLTILFVIKGSALFPATAALAWGVLAYVCVDFGFWNKIINITPVSGPVWRAGVETFLAASLLIFIYAYLHLNRWHSHFSTVAVAWILGLVTMFGVAILEPSVTAGIARFSFALTCLAGAGVIAWLSLNRYDRAIMLIPTWTLALVWTLGAWLTVTGRISNDIVQPALGGGMVLIVMLLGFTVMQHAFAGGPLAQGLVSNVERQALALTGSSGIVWDWDVVRDHIHTGDAASGILGIPPATMSGPSRNWLALLHPNDRDRFQATLDAIIEHRRGRILQAFRFRSDHGHYYWFELRARPMLGTDGEVIRCVGTIEDITDRKNAEERMLHDAVHDNLTGLENRELFTNRLDTVMNLARTTEGVRPSVFHINIDQFREINAKLGFNVGDTILLTVARRLFRLLKEGDCLARLGGDQFALMLLSEVSPERIAGFADSARRALAAPIQFADETIELTASIGIASWTPEHREPRQLMRDAELAMVHARRFGGHRIEPFRPAFRSSRDEATVLLEDLKQAIEGDQFSLVYQPIVRLADRGIRGFEALVRWNHPKLGVVPPGEFIPLAEGSGLINKLGLSVLDKAARDFRAITEGLGDNDLFVGINISSRELLRHDIVADITKVLKQHKLEAKHLRIELTEGLVMENPEYSAEVLARIRSLGIGLSLDDFGTGYSSLAYLMRFPFDTIKIDRTFMQERQRKERPVILRAIAAMAHGLNQQLVVEGVETESDVAELLQLGCEFGQGYLFGAPMSASDTTTLLKQEFRMAGQ